MKIDEFLAEISKLQDAAKLLEDIYSQVGPYNNGTIDDKTISKMQKYFNFDDSE